MVTKTQALTCKQFKQTRMPIKTSIFYNGGLPYQMYSLQDTVECKPINWRANGKCKTWQNRPDEFKLPIKHGLYDYAYITHENAHLFEVA